METITKKQKDYGNGKIYMIRDNTNQQIYIGSTTKKYLSQRKGEHVVSYNKWTNTEKGYCSSFDIIKNGDYICVLVELYPCKTYEELRMREQYHIDLNAGCLNRARAYSSPEYLKEQQKIYFENNKEHLIECNKKWEKDNKESIKEKRKLYSEKNKEHIAKRHKQYRQDNLELENARSKKYKDANIEKLKKYRDDNADIIKARCAIKKVCECGCEVTQYKLPRHLETKRHIELMKIINPSERKLKPALANSP